MPIIQSTFNNNYGRKFVCLDFTKETNENLLNYCKKLNIDCTKNHNGDDISEKDYRFHCTLIYSSENNINVFPMPNGKYTVPPFIKLRPEKFEVFGESNNCLVLKLDTSESLMRLRKYFEYYGCRDDWPSYKPHITLSYNYRNEFNGNFPPLPNFEIKPIGFTIESIKD